MGDLFQNILTASFHGSLVILAILLLRPILKKGPKKFLCMLWLLAFIRLILPFELESSLSLQPNILPIPETKQEEAAPLPYAENPERIADSEGADILWEDNLAPEFQVSTPEKAQDEMGGALPPVKESVSPLTVFSIVWLSVSSLFLIFSILSYTHLRLSVRDAIRTKEAWESERIETAFILGFIRPRIYIPMGMNPIVRKYILAHERTHLEKGDQWLKLFGYLTLAIHWFNPLVWAAYILLCKDIELACDERVVQFMVLSERKAYSSALLACSANRIHLAACPVAFGEVSAKERIKAVLHYKKPAFWISLICVLAIIFVLVCLMTNPKRELSETDATPLPIEETTATTTAAETTLPSSGGPMEDISESEIPDICRMALDSLRMQKNFYFITEYSQQRSPQEPPVFKTEFRKYGEDYLRQSLPAEAGQIQLPMEGTVKSGEIYARRNGIYWILEEENPQDPSAILDDYDPDGVTVTFPEGTGVIDGHTLRFQGEWISHFPGEEIPNVGIFTYSFDDTGNLLKLAKETRFLTSQGQEVIVRTALSVMEEHPSLTRETIRATAATAIPKDEVHARQIQDSQVTEIPSNKTLYDRDFALGAGQMGWNFQNGGWFMKFGAENPNSTGLDLTWEFAGPFGDHESERVSGTAVTGDTFYLEIFRNGAWETLPLLKEDQNTLKPQSISSGVTFHVKWEDSYGSLPAGFYRIGMDYHLTTEAGKQENHFCYAKFRVYDPNIYAKITLCRTGVQALLDRESYHIQVQQTVDRGTQEEAVMKDEIWKSDSDYLMLTTSFQVKDNLFRFADGKSIFGGQGYTMEYADPNFTTRTERSPEDFITPEIMELWSFRYEIMDGQVQDISRSGDLVTVTCDHGDELVFRFDRKERLIGAQSFQTDAEGNRLLQCEMQVIEDSPAEIRDKIQAVNKDRTS